MLGAVPPGTLSARLDELAEPGVLERRIVDARPPRTEYVLTARGQRVSAVLDELLRRAGTSRTAALFFPRRVDPRDADGVPPARLEGRAS